MSAILRSRMMRATAFCLGFPAAVSTMSIFSSSYNYYMGSSLGQGFIIFFPLLIACMVTLFLSVLKSSSSEHTPAWRKVDFSFWAISSFCFVLACGYLIRGGTSQLLLVSAIVYTVVMALIAEATARYRDKQIFSTLYWLQFFKQYPLQEPIGFIMALLLVIQLLYIMLVFPVSATKGYLGIEYFILVIVLLSLAILTYIGTFIMSLSSRYEEANIEKIRAEQFKVELITNVSHDIRTPLTSIINYVDLLKGLPIKRADFKEYVGILDSKASRLTTLIGDLMEASKASTGNVGVELSEVDLTEIVGQVAGEFDDQFKENELTLVMRQPEGPVMIFADSSHLWRVLENLFSNVVKYTQSGTRVFAEIALSDNRALFSMKNTSQAPIDLSSDMMTEQFIRGDKARQTEGSGLGLYIAKSLVELMGGSFTIRTNGDLFEVETMFLVTIDDADEVIVQDVSRHKISWRNMAIFGVLVIVVLFSLIFMDVMMTRGRNVSVEYHEPYYIDGAEGIIYLDEETKSDVLEDFLRR